MRILVYSYNYHPEPIGIAPLMTELAEGLATRGHEVRVVTAMPNYPERKIYPDYRGQLFLEEERNGVRIQRCFVAIRPNPGLVTRVLLDGSFSLLSLFQALKGWRPDIILSTSPSLPASVPVSVVKTLFSCPVVLSLQDILPEAAVQTGLITNKLAIRAFELLEKFAYASVDRIAVITPSFADNLRGKGVRPEKMTCVSNWVDVNFIRPQSKTDNAFRAKHGLQDKFVVLYSGNIARTQGVRTIVRAAEQLMGQSHIQFVIVGERRQLTDLENLKAELGVTNLTLLPFAPRRELPEMLAAADVSLIMQKKNVVGFNMPSKTMVLLASGRPVIASVPRDGAPARAIRDSKGGIVTPPENPSLLARAILNLSKDPDRAEAMGKQGRQYAIQNYSFEQALESYESLLKSLVVAPLSGRLTPAKATPMGSVKKASGL
ncbi:MAG: glycosyltransferase family 4 protein [Cyanobacteria bacterium P01_A01_bin.105]